MSTKLTAEQFIKRLKTFGSRPSSKRSSVTSNPAPANAYMGGATATHVRIGDLFFLPIVLGILVWLGLYLRDARLRPLMPLTKG